MERFFKKESDCHFYVDKKSIPIGMPTLFSQYTHKTLQVIERVNLQNNFTGETKHELQVKEIGEQTAYQICNRLGLFLEYVDNLTNNQFISLNVHTALPEEIINEYLNEYLIGECGKSLDAVEKHKVALDAYYNWLACYFNNKPKYLFIKTRYRPLARENSSKPLIVNYFLPRTRELFYANAKTLLQKIVLKNGGELGCRTKENQGFLLEDFKAGKQTYSGLLTLFKLMKTNPEKEEFEYFLSSIYTKYGRPRTLYIPRHLLELMERYYKEERPKSISNHLLVSNSNKNRGECISVRYGSDTFDEIKKITQKKIKENPEVYDDIQEIHDDHSYHVLRHSFGTDLFYNMCHGQNKSFESITTTSAVYIETARRMGHKVDSNGASQVTKGYIHSCGYRESLLKESINASG